MLTAFFTIPTASTTDIFTHLSQIFTDTAPFTVIILGIGLSFWLVEWLIGVSSPREPGSYEYEAYQARRDTKRARAAVKDLEEK